MHRGWLGLVIANVLGTENLLVFEESFGGVTRHTCHTVRSRRKMANMQAEVLQKR